MDPPATRNNEDGNQIPTLMMTLMTFAALPIDDFKKPAAGLDSTDHDLVHRISGGGHHEGRGMDAGNVAWRGHGLCL
jgi:hypothetical protein